MRAAPSPARRPRPQQAVAMTKERGGEPPAGGAPTPDPPSPLVERRKKPMVHPAAPAPLPKDYAFTFFDPNDAACREILLDPRTTVPQLFAILRQWVPQVQHSVDLIGNEILRRGCHVNDRDGLTDMTLLHYACKAGAHGVGDPAAAVRLSTRLLALGGDVTLRSRWTHMNALHYAAYFDVPELIRTLLRAAAPRVLHSTCSDFSHGTALHIAASNLCLGAVRCLLEHGADPALRNSKGQVAAEVVPDPTDMALDKAEAALAARELRQLLLDAVPLSCSLPRVTLPNYDNLPGNLMLLCLGLQLGDRVRVDGGKVSLPLSPRSPRRRSSPQWPPPPAAPLDPQPEPPPRPGRTREPAGSVAGRGWTGRGAAWPRGTRCWWPDSARGGPGSTGALTSPPGTGLGWSWTQPGGNTTAPFSGCGTSPAPPNTASSPPPPVCRGSGVPGRSRRMVPQKRRCSRSPCHSPSATSRRCGPRRTSPQRAPSPAPPSCSGAPRWRQTRDQKGGASFPEHAHTGCLAPPRAFGPPPPLPSGAPRRSSPLGHASSAPAKLSQRSAPPLSARGRPSSRAGPAVAPRRRRARSLSQ
ncbi:CAP-Gly domain-containing linker protein 3 isoform X2 [Buteo buteo]|uniref:CAP-Gly domain-containing linker protein 3 isoform X2 n=1 Tax=Buteo buteo TaxID=30397 RepID=UPI003EBB2C90